MQSVEASWDEHYIRSIDLARPGARNIQLSIGKMLGHAFVVICVLRLEIVVQDYCTRQLMFGPVEADRCEWARDLRQLRVPLDRSGYVFTYAGGVNDRYSMLH